MAYHAIARSGAALDCSSSSDVDDGCGLQCMGFMQQSLMDLANRVGERKQEAELASSTAAQLAQLRREVKDIHKMVDKAVDPFTRQLKKALKQSYTADIHSQLHLVKTKNDTRIEDILDQKFQRLFLPTGLRGQAGQHFRDQVRRALRQVGEDEVMYCQHAANISHGSSRHHLHLVTCNNRHSGC